MSVLHVNDRPYTAMLDGALVTRWPDDVEVPSVGERVTVFDRDLEFTQHEAKRVDGRRVWLGPAIEFDR